MAKSSIRKHPHSMNPERTVDKKGWRTNATIRRLHMYKETGPVRNNKGKIIKSASFQSRLNPGTVARVAPDRRWFGNTRLIGQESLQKFQDVMEKAKHDPFTLVLKKSKLPCSLLTSGLNTKKTMKLLDVEPYEKTMGKGCQRKRPKLAIDKLEDYALSANVESSSGISNLPNQCDTSVVCAEHESPAFRAGTSKRIWNELYKVIDSSDVVIEVLDARNPMETRCWDVERYIRHEKPHKHVVLLLNKIDLVPTNIAKSWVGVLSKEYPTVAFKSSITNPFGKTTFINLLRQFALLHYDRQQISVGMVGFPNVGKSSIINTLRGKKVCCVAPIPGETKVWQYVTLMKRIYLIDCPGVVVSNFNKIQRDISDEQTKGFCEKLNSHRSNSEVSDFAEAQRQRLVLNGAIRVEHIRDPETYIPALLDRVQSMHLNRAYGLKDESWKTPNELLCILAKRLGRLGKHGKPDCNSAARTLLIDFQRSKIPHFTLPPAGSKSMINANPNERENDKEKDIEEPSLLKDCEDEVTQDSEDMCDIMKDIEDAYEPIEDREDASKMT